MPIDKYKAMIGYEDRNVDLRSSEVYEPPRRTISNRWVKFHADPKRDCGSRNVHFIETQRNAIGEKYEYDLYCANCRQRVNEENVLFIGGEWYADKGWEAYQRPVEDIHMPSERVVELGPNPSEEELRDALEVTRIEGEANLIGLTFGTETTNTCNDCEHETPLTFDEKCRMCYDGPWTDRMTDTLIAAEDSIRKRNGSFVHTLENKIDPVSINNKAHTGSILWRRNRTEGTTKIVEVLQCLQDDDDGHREYILTDVTRTEEWRYPQEELVECFYDTGLNNTTTGKAITDDRIRELHDRLKK